MTQREIWWKLTIIRDAQRRDVPIPVLLWTKGRTVTALAARDGASIKRGDTVTTLLLRSVVLGAYGQGLHGEGVAWRLVPWVDGVSAGEGAQTDSPSPAMERVVELHHELAAAVERVKAPTAPAPAPAALHAPDPCSRCGSLDVFKLSSCKTKCKRCGLEEGGCG